MKKTLFLFNIACFLILLLTGCHSSHEAVASRSSSRQPKFINNVYIDPHAKNGATANAIDHTRRPEKPRTAQKPAAVKPSPAKPVAAAANSAHKASAPKQEESGSLIKKYASMLGLTPAQIRNFSLYHFIDDWLGTDYRFGGSDDNGIDCSAFAQKLYGEVYGIDLLRTAVEQFSNCKRIKNPKDASEGDLVFFHVRSKRISHVGVYLANNYFVHASRSGGVIISNLDEEYWHRCFAGCGRIPSS